MSAVGLLIRLAPPEFRGRATGLFTTAFLVGTVAGPVLGGGLLVFSLRLPFVVYTISLLVAALVAWLFLRNSALAAPERTTDVSPVRLSRALRHGAYRAALVASFAKGWVAMGIRLSVVVGFQMASDLGVVVGPILAGVLVDTGSFQLAFTVTAAVSVLALLVWLRAPETLGERNEADRGVPSGAT